MCLQRSSICPCRQEPLGQKTILSVFMVLDLWYNFYLYSLHSYTRGPCAWNPSTSHTSRRVVNSLKAQDTWDSEFEFLRRECIQHTLKEEQLGQHVHSGNSSIVHIYPKILWRGTTPEESWEILFWIEKSRGFSANKACVFCRWLSEESLLCATAAALIAKHGLQTPENKCLPQLYDVLFWIFATFNISEKNVILLFNKAKSMAIKKHMNHKACFEVRIQNQLPHEYRQRK